MTIKKLKTAIALMLMLAIVFPIVSQFASAQSYSVRLRISGAYYIGGEMTIHFEVLDATQQRVSYPWTDLKIGVRWPNRNYNVEYGPFNVDSTGHFEWKFYPNETGRFSFIWMLPYQGPLPPSTRADGSWRSNIEGQFVIGTVPEHTKATYPYIGVTPNPVGVGQEVLIHLGITDELYLYHQGWEGLTVTVEKPDGKNETLGPFRTDATGGTGTIYVPNMVGNYTFQTHFPQQKYLWVQTGGANVTYLAGNSEKKTLVVQAQPLSFWPGVPLPTEYWTRPVDSQYREWASIAGNWLSYPEHGVAANNNDAPESPHVLWTKPLATGGLVGGEFGDYSYEQGDAYEGKFLSSVIINGILYHNRFQSIETGGPESQGIVAVDLKSGKELWFRNNTRLSFGQILYWNSFNYHGAFAYLWETVGTDWHAYDALTGEWVYNIRDVPSGSNIYGPDGTIYRYTIDLDNGWMSFWNSTKTVNPQDRNDSWDGSWQRNMGRDAFLRNYPAIRGVEWNITIPKRGWPGSTGIVGTTHAVLFEDMILMSTTHSRTATIVEAGKAGAPIQFVGISLKPGREGQMLYNISWQPPPGNLSMAPGVVSEKYRVFTLWSKEARAHWGFDLDTGKPLWGPTTPPQHYLDVFIPSNFAVEDKLISGRMGGEIYAYDIRTGKPLWSHIVPDVYKGVLWSDNWPIRPLFFAGGKIYLAHSEHSPVNPLARGAPFVALDLETGEEVFYVEGLLRVTDWGGRPIIGDNVIAAFNTYDNRIYSYGKGPSQITVNGPEVVQPLGTPVVIHGTVTDISPGTKEYALEARFPNGVPAVADQYMGEWMKYVYQQNVRPADATGVEVTLSVIDSNGNFREIGKTTSDASGFYSFQWTPDITGKYAVVANFAGSKSYWPSSAETAFAVIPLTAQQVPAPEYSTSTSTYLLVIGAAIVIAVAIVGVALALIMKKRL